MALTHHNGFHPIGDWVYIEREAAQLKEGNIWLPDISQFEGVIADVIGIGGDVDNTHIRPGHKVLIKPAETFSPFHDPRRGLTLGTSVIATFKGQHGKESIIPLNSYILVSPDGVIKERGDIALPDGSEIHRMTGTVVRIADDVDLVKVGHKVIYEPYRCFSCSERGHDRHLMRDALAIKHSEDDIEPIGAILLVEVDELGSNLIVMPQRGLALPGAPDIQLPEKAVSAPPTATVKAVGNAVEHGDEVKAGDRVLLQLEQTMLRNPGVQFDKDQPRMRLVNEIDILGRIEE